MWLWKKVCIYHMNYLVISFFIWINRYIYTKEICNNVYWIKFGYKNLTGDINFFNISVILHVFCMNILIQNEYKIMDILNVTKNLFLLMNLCFSIYMLCYKDFV